MRLRPAALIVAAALACGGPETVVQIQGTVTAVGSGLPVRGADVGVEWARGSGGGAMTLHTDRDGHYAGRRSVHLASVTCNGTVITVRKSGFASAYNAYSDSTCGSGNVLTLDFKLIPIPQ